MATKLGKNLSLIVKLILALPVLDIFWGIVRILRSADKHNTVGIVLGIIMLFVGAAIWWIVDFICILLTGDIVWLD